MEREGWRGRDEEGGRKRRRGREGEEEMEGKKGGEEGREGKRGRRKGERRKRDEREEKGRSEYKGTGDIKKEGRWRKKEGEEEERKYNYLQNTTQLMYTIYYIMVLKISYSESLQHYTIISLVTNPCAPPGEKRSGEQSRIIGLITLKQ